MGRTISVLKNKLEVDGTTPAGADRCLISSLNAPTEAQRGALVRRRAYLADALAPRLNDRELVADAILEMFYAWPDTRRMDAGKAAATAAKYAATVSDLPLWAIQAACDQLTREDRDFPPSAGTLRTAALQACAAARDELTDLRRILAAEVYTPTPHADDAKERVREVARKFGEPFRPTDRRPDARRDVVEERNAATARLHEMAREVGNEWRE